MILQDGPVLRDGPVVSGKSDTRDPTQSERSRPVHHYF